MSDRRHTIFLEVKTKGTADAKAQAEALDKVSGSAKTAQRSLAEIDRERHQAQRQQWQPPIARQLPPTLQPPVAREPARDAGFLASGRVGRFLGVGLGVGAGARAFEGAGEFLNQAAASDRVMGGPEMIGQMAAEAAKSVPILGSHVRGLESFSSAVTGTTSEIAASRRFFETSQRMIGTESQVNAVERAARSEMFGYGRTATDSKIAAESARGYSDFVSANPRLRGPDLDIARARFGVDEARALAEQRQREIGGPLPSGPADLDKRIKDQRNAVNRANQRSTGLQLAIDEKNNSSDIWTGGGRYQRNQLQAQLATSQDDAAKQQAQLAELLKAKEADLATIKERQMAANKANLDLARSQYELSKAQLDKEQSRLDKAKTLAQTIGSSSRSDQLQALRILETIDSKGIGSVSPEEAQFASRFAQQYVQTKQIDAGQNNPLFPRFNKFAQDTTAISGQLGDMEKRLNAENARIIAELKEAQARANTNLATDLAKIIVTEATTIVERIRLEVKKELNAGALQQAAAQG